MTSRLDPAALSRTGAEQHGDRTALICGSFTQTYAELHERGRRLVAVLRGLGVERGERVAVLADNSPEALEIISGLATGGFVRATLYAHNSPGSNLYLLQLVDAAVLLVQRRHHDAIRHLLPQAPALRHVIVFDGETPAGALPYDRLLAAADPAPEEPLPALDELQLIRFSAGTTGKPKAIVHLVHQRSAIALQMSRLLGPLDPSDRYVAAAPLSHATSLPVWPIMAAGGAVVLLRRFDAGDLLAAIGRERASITFGVPTMVDAVARHPDAATTDLGSLRAFVYGGAPMTPAVLTRGRAVFGDVFMQLYGQSEAGVPLTVLRPEEHVGADAARLRSVGRAMQDTTITIVDDDLRPLPPGTVGEVAARSPGAMEGFWGDPDATAQRKLPDGTVLTHDMGYLDEDGFLYLTDRKEEMIISGGFNIWPAELEAALADHPAVREVSVFGIPHERWGETPMAVVVLEPGAEATEEELVTWSREQLGAVKRVTAVAFADDLPRTPIGKVLRRKARELHGPSAAKG
ncbi:class I adenylate-forming enzyme family protein [Conexibacter arvalis]|uniref:Acyl-CoA synthetase (AMP-forming)/AMP-acid ligase II n=1 Tax=Conexibacter arvalis TaxID=912552 RepID=A0A840I6S7_9ACTN|nr:AMP-binding protein [Conexibacter arvalis]MBB4660626.1 acyl-CoA synthetase (AMP-forming)/AMP-acid ligase II [Conexibacter arvalis]